MQNLKHCVEGLLQVPEPRDRAWRREGFHLRFRCLNAEKLQKKIEIPFEYIHTNEVPFPNPLPYCWICPAPPNGVNGVGPAAPAAFSTRLLSSPLMPVCILLELLGNYLQYNFL